MFEPIETPRLILEPFTHALVQAALSDPDQLARRLGIRVPPAWPGPDFADILPAELELAARSPERAVWSRLIVLRAERALVGDIGLKGGPDASGTADMGYSILPDYRGRGYATEAARALVDWAFARPEVLRITADCLADNSASIRVLEKLGMRRLGTAESAEGRLVKWELHRRDWQAAPA